MEKVSIVVPVYKVEEWLERCVKSIQNQTYSNIEIILVDDGSPDRSGEMCDQFAAQDSRIKVVHKLNGGLSDARNVGAKIATGKYLLFVDSDDYISEKLVEKTVKVAEKDNCDVVLFDFYRVEKDKKTILTNDVPANQMINLKEEHRLLLIPPAAWNKLYNRDFYNRLGYTFPKGFYYEDLGTTPKIIAEAERIEYLKEPLYYYEIREGSIMHTKNFEKNFKDRTAVLEDILSFFQEKNMFETYKNELEYLVFENGYYFPSKEIVLSDKKSPYLEKFREYAYNRFPDLDKNIYAKALSRKNKILWLFLKNRHYNAMIALSYVRRLKDYVKGAKKRWNW